MALLKNIEINNSGVIVEYWRIARAIVEFASNANEGADDRVEILVHGYKSKQDRDSGKNYVVARTINYTASQIGGVEQISRPGLYASLKSDPDFHDAENI